MPEVTIHLNGRDYAIACDDGQERRLLELARALERRVETLVGQFGQVGDARLLVMAGLLVLDDLDEAHQDIAALQSTRRDGATAGQDEALGAAMDGIARRIEDIAARLESA